MMVTSVIGVAVVELLFHLHLQQAQALQCQSR
ncbi:hypothetical protein B566_EDAN017525 [Ephemera danica]|nr:hypothetical protein B566_EDAN017525 [Ephemera danica]